MSNNEGWVHEQIQGAPLRLAVFVRVCIYVCGGNGGLKKSRIVHADDASTASASACPLDQVPARHPVSDDEPVLVDPPLSVHGADGLDGLLVSRPGASLAGVFPAAPDARRQVAEIPVGCPKPIPASNATLVKPGGSRGRGRAARRGAKDLLEEAAAGCGLCMCRLVEVSKVAVVDALLVP